MGCRQFFSCKKLKVRHKVLLKSGKENGMSGVQYLWEDFYDRLLVQERAHEPRESLAEVKNRLRLGKHHASV